MTTRPARIVVGCDGSPDSRDAVRWAADYVKRVDGALELVSAWEWPSFQDVPIVYGGYDPRATCQHFLDRMRQDVDLEDDQVTLTVVKGHPARVLVDHVSTTDLLVVGSHGQGVFSRLVLGSVSARCAAHAPCPVVIVRQPEKLPPRPHVLVGVDDSPSARAALRWAVDYADLTLSPLTLLRAVESPPPIPPGYPVTFSHPREDLHNSIRSWLRELIDKEQADRGRELAAGVRLLVMDGNAAHIMVDESTSAALTVVGRRGAGGFRRLLIGSVASALAHHSHSTVVVVPSA